MFIKFISIAILLFVSYFLFVKIILPSLRGESIGASAKKKELLEAVTKQREQEEINRLEKEMLRETKSIDESKSVN